MNQTDKLERMMFSNDPEMAILGIITMIGLYPMVDLYQKYRKKFDYMPIQRDNINVIFRKGGYFFWYHYGILSMRAKGELKRIIKGYRPRIITL